MDPSATSTDYAVRPYRDDDEPAVVRLIDEALVVGPGGAPPSRFFRWKHLDNPFGRSFMLVADDGGRIIGLRAFMRWTFRAGGAPRSAVRAVDTATDEAHRGRGVFSRLTSEALEALRGDVDFVFNTPNRQSGPGYLKLGWRMVGKIPVRVRVRRPLRFVLGARSATDGVPAGAALRSGAETADSALADADAVAELLAEGDEAGHRLATPRDLRYLRWRYGAAPVLDYGAVRLESGGTLRGLAIFRLRERGRLRETSLAELIVRPGDTASARRLLREVRRAAPSDHVVCHFATGTTAAAAALRAGFLPAPAGPVFVVRPLAQDVRPDPLRLESWALSLGDVEVF